MLAVLTRERKRVEELGATVEQRAFDLAETAAVWRNALWAAAAPRSPAAPG